MAAENNADAGVSIPGISKDKKEILDPEEYVDQMIRGYIGDVELGPSPSYTKLGNKLFSMLSQSVETNTKSYQEEGSYLRVSSTGKNLSCWVDTFLALTSKTYRSARMHQQEILTELVRGGMKDHIDELLEPFPESFKKAPAFADAEKAVREDLNATTGEIRDLTGFVIAWYFGFNLVYLRREGDKWILHSPFVYQTPECKVIFMYLLQSPRHYEQLVHGTSPEDAKRVFSWEDTALCDLKAMYTADVIPTEATLGDLAKYFKEWKYPICSKAEAAAAAEDAAALGEILGEDEEVAAVAAAGAEAPGATKGGSGNSEGSLEMAAPSLSGYTAFGRDPEIENDLDDMPLAPSSNLLTSAPKFNSSSVEFNPAGYKGNDASGTSPLGFDFKQGKLYANARIGSQPARIRGNSVSNLKTKFNQASLQNRTKREAAQKAAMEAKQQANRTARKAAANAAQKRANLQKQAENAKRAAANAAAKQKAAAAAAKEAKLAAERQAYATAKQTGQQLTLKQRLTGRATPTTYNANQTGNPFGAAAAPAATPKKGFFSSMFSKKGGRRTRRNMSRKNRKGSRKNRRTSRRN